MFNYVCHVPIGAWIMMMICFVIGSRISVEMF